MLGVIVIDGPGGPLELRVIGDGHPVVMIPSLGRGAADFDDLAARLAARGFRAIAPEPRGIGASTSSLDNLAMDDLADDVAAVIRWAGDGRATVVGHAFGNRVARMTATRHPDLVESVVLLACGGRIPASAEAVAALRAVFDPERSAAEHSAAVRTAFFAPGNDPDVWFDGWYGVVAAVQGKANSETPVETWWEAGDAAVLVVQPADDVIAVPANGEHIVEALGDRARMVTIPNAGHALLPEQPDDVAREVLAWLDRAVVTGARHLL